MKFSVVRLLPPEKPPYVVCHQDAALIPDGGDILPLGRESDGLYVLVVRDIASGLTGNDDWMIRHLGVQVGERLGVQVGERLGRQQPGLD
jgi:hypothetical protein